MIGSEYLLDFGALGAVLIWMMIQHQKQQKREDVLTDRLLTTIENNTAALQRFWDALETSVDEGK